MMGMRNQIKTALTVVVLAAIALAAWEGLRASHPEPVYHGKGLKFWLENYEHDMLALHLGARPEQTSGARDAIRAMGTNAIPRLLGMLRERDGALHSALIKLWDRHVMRLRWVPAWLRHPAWVRNSAVVENRLAMTGFEILRDDARLAVPALIGIYQENISWSSLYAASSALVSIGSAASNAIPVFVQVASDPRDARRESAVDALVQMNYRMKLEPRLLVPVFTNALNDPRWAVRRTAAEGLANLGPAGRQAVPTLLQSLNDTNRFVLTWVVYALKQIDPIAAHGVGINTNSLGL
jgi:hypothetical protein